jgi:hypothetical protein
MHPNVKTGSAHIVLAIRDGWFLTDAAFRRVFLTAYTLSFAWIFLIPADFWDDLAVKNNPDLIKMTNEAGLLPAGWFITGLLSLPYRDFIGHAYVFLLYMAVPLLVRRFVAEFMPASEREKNAIALLTAVLPLYLSRFQIAASYYCLSLLLFCVGSLLLGRAIVRSGPIFLRIAAYICLALSFFTQSFVAFYGFVVLLITLCLARQMKGPSPTARFIAAAFIMVRRAPDAVVLPFVFFFLKTFLVGTAGPFVTYNAVTLPGLLDALPALPFTAINSLANAVGISASWLAFGVTLLLAAAGTLLLRPVDAPPAEPKTEPKAGAALLVVFCGLMFAIFPYAVVSRLPTPFDFEDRNQLTMLLVAGAAITYGAKGLIRDHLRWTVIFLALVWAIASDAWAYIAIIADGHMQNAVVRAFHDSEAARTNKSLLVDFSQWPNRARGRSPSTAELNCLTKQAFGDESHFAAAMSYRPFDWKANLAAHRRFLQTGSCFRGYRGGEPLLLTISPGPKVLMLRSVAKLSVLWMLDADRYQKALDGFVSVSVTPAPSGWLKAP